MTSHMTSWVKPELKRMWSCKCPRPKFHGINAVGGRWNRFFSGFEKSLQVFRYAECYISLKVCITFKAFKRRHRMVCVQGPNSMNILLLTIPASDHTPCFARPLIKIERPQADGCWGTNMQNYAKTMRKLCENDVKTNWHKNSAKPMRELCKNYAKT